MLMLNPRQRAFALAYVKDPNATSAAKSAGYSPKTAHVIGCQLLKHTEVAAEIARLVKHSEKKSALSVELVTNALSNLVSFDVASCYDDDGKLLAINKMPIEMRNAIAGIDGHKLRFSSRLGAIELSAKLLGMVKDQQVQQQAVQITIAAPVQQLEVSAERPQLRPEWD